MFSQTEVDNAIHLSLTCENNHDFSGKNPLLGYQLLGSSSHTTRCVIFSLRLKDAFFGQINIGFMYRNSSSSGDPVRVNAGIPRNRVPVLLFGLDLTRRSQWSELESQEPICHMNAISGYLQSCCFPLKQKWNNKSHDNTTKNAAHAKV